VEDGNDGALYLFYFFLIILIYNLFRGSLGANSLRVAWWTVCH
jgi:hypothetical protein